MAAEVSLRMQRCSVRRLTSRDKIDKVAVGEKSKWNGSVRDQFLPMTIVV